MQKLIFVINSILGLIADFLYAPLVRAHLREVALKAPLLPGQNWVLPHLGWVRVTTVGDHYVSYRVIEGDDEILTCSRKDFVILCRSEQDSDSSGQVIPFKIYTNKDKE